MDCKKYRDNYDRFNEFPLKEEVWGTEEYQQHVEHFHDCEQCGIWGMEQEAIKKGLDFSIYCCSEMALNLSKGINTEPYKDPDVVIVHNKKYDVYGLPIQDGGTSFIKIKHCPWCGVKLPELKRTTGGKHL